MVFTISVRGSHETGGVWKMSALDEDVQDLVVVVEYLTRIYGYIIDLVVGHSRGCLVSMRWLCTSEHARNVRGFVNVSGRYRMEVSRLSLSKIDGFENQPSAYMASVWRIRQRILFNF